MKISINICNSLQRGLRVVCAIAIGACVAALVPGWPGATASAQTVSRDHRGPDGAPSGGVTVNGSKAKVTQAPKIGGPKWRGGYDALGAPGEKGRPSGVTVRDHRN